jgi:hypothetical protein
MQGEIKSIQRSNLVIRYSEEYDVQSDNKQRVTWLVTYAKQLIV